MHDYKTHKNISKKIPNLRPEYAYLFLGLFLTPDFANIFDRIF
jgi:hypothetical protein